MDHKTLWDQTQTKFEDHTATPKDKDSIDDFKAVMFRTSSSTYGVHNVKPGTHLTETKFSNQIDSKFTAHLAQSGMWRNAGLNSTKTRSKALTDPTAWGSWTAPHFG